MPPRKRMPWKIMIIIFFYFYNLQFSLSTSLFCPNMPISTHRYTKVLLVNVIIENFVAYSCLIYITKVHIWQQIKLMLGTWSGFMIIWQSLILLWEKKNNLITSATLFMIPGTSNSGIIRIPLTLANSMISRTSSGVYVIEGW